MAFQTGTTIRPELATADFSGFARAAEIQANSLAQLGATIGSAIRKHKAKKEEKLFNDSVDDFLSTNAQKETPFGNALRQLGITGKESASVARKALDDDLMPTLKMLMSNEEDPTTSTQIISIGRMLERPEFKGIKFDETGEAFMEIPNKDTLMPFDKKRVPVPEEIKNIPGFEDYAASRRTVPKVNTKPLPDADSDDPISSF